MKGAHDFKQLLRITLLAAAAGLAACNGSSGITAPVPASTPSYVYPAAPATEAAVDYNGASYLTWPTSANGNIAPSTLVTGAATGFNQPAGIAYDSTGKVYVADRSGDH